MESRLKDLPAGTVSGPTGSLISLREATKTYRDGNVTAVAGVTLEMVIRQPVSVTEPTAAVYRPCCT